MALSKLFIKEVEILQDVLNSEAKRLLGTIDDNEKKAFKRYLKRGVGIGSLLYCITKDLSSEDLLNMKDAEIIEHIQRLQQIENEK